MSFGELGGPVGCLGVAMLLAAASPRARVTGLVLVGLGASLLGAEVAPDAHRTAVALGVAAVVGVSAPVALLLRRWPWILAFAVLPAVPARVPLDLGGTHAQLELPLYLLAGAAGFQIALETLKGDRRARELGPLAVPLAAFVLWTGLSILWSNDVRAGSFELLAYFLPFGVIAVGIARAPWSRRALTWLALELLGLALLFAAVGVYQYTTRNLFWNPKVIVGNAYLPFYRVNSVFWDPSIYGRFLMIAIVVGLVAVVRGESKRYAVGAATALAAIWIGLLLSYSQSSFAGLIVAVVVLLALVWRRAALLATAFVALVLLSTGIANPNVQNAFLKRSGAALNRATSDRAGLVYNGVRIAIDNPVAGVGVGAFRHHYAALTGLKGKEPKKAASHDTPVTVAAENGLVGLGLFAWVLVAALGMLARAKGDPFQRRVVLAVALGLVAITVHSLFYNHFFEDPTTWALLGLAGLAYAASGEARLIPVRSATPRRSRGREARRASPAPAPAGPAA
jgi:hypothetical protein